MRLKGVIVEDFSNYKKPSMFLVSYICDWKCCVENNLPVSTCQNFSLVYPNPIEYTSEKLLDLYNKSELSKAIVIGGLEPMLQINELIELISYFRTHNCSDEFIIYTGYYPEEIPYELSKLKLFDNIIVKFGRYIPNIDSIYDDLLGVTLISNNQFSQKIS